MSAVRISTDYIWSEGSEQPEPYIVAWPIDNDPAACCANFVAAINTVLPGVPAVIVAIQPGGDIRAYGEGFCLVQASRLNLADRLWRIIEVPDALLAPVPTRCAAGALSAPSTPGRRARWR